MISRRLVDTRAGAVHVWIGEGDGLPLLLLHMSPRSGRMYLPFMERFDRPTAAPDRPGFGFSDAMPVAPTIGRYAEVTLDLVDGLGWDTFDVVGTHTGSVEAVEVAHRAPDRVRRVGLVAVPVYTDEEIVERSRGVAAPRPAPRRDGGHLVSLWRRRVDIRRPPVDLEHLQALFVDELLSSSQVHRAYQAVLEYPMEERVRSLGRPVTVFVPHDDLLDQTRRALPLLPIGSTVVELPHLSFDLWSEAPEELVRLIDRDFGPHPLERRSTDG